MAKSSSDWFSGTLLLVCGIAVLANVMRSSMSPDDHTYIEGIVTDLHTAAHHPKKPKYQTFKIKDIRYHGKVFDTYDLERSSGWNTNIEDHIASGKVIGFHVQKDEFNDNPISIYSLKSNGEVIVSLEKKKKVRFWNIGIVIFCLVGAVLLFGFFN